MNIKILGPGCTNCVNLEKVTRQAVQELGIEATIEKVTDMGEIMSYGIMSTPGLVIDDDVKIAGRVPKVKKIVEVLTAD